MWRWVLLVGLASCKIVPAICVSRFLDEDGDGFGSAIEVSSCLVPDEGTWVETPGDCDDGDPARSPVAVERCNGLDDDCNGAIDESGGTRWYRDRDSDGHGNDEDWVIACSLPVGFVEEGRDCDDLDATAFPNAVEVCDGIDNDCDGDADGELNQRWWLDEDNDGLGAEGEGVLRLCSEGQPGPGNWVTNGLDCDDTDATTGTSTEWWPDLDRDGRGDATGPTVVSCGQPPGDWSGDGDDCDDADASTYLGAVEVCDGADNDCDGNGDVEVQWWPDLDDDGHGDAGGAAQLDCEEPGGGDWSTLDDDCDDSDSSVHEGATEVCDGVDNDCDPATEIDEGSTCGTDGVPWFDATHGNYIFFDSPFNYAGAGTICDSFNYRIVYLETLAEELAVTTEASAMGFADNEFWLGASSECITPMDTEWAWEDPIAGDCIAFTGYALSRAPAVNFRLVTSQVVDDPWLQTGSGSSHRVVCELP